MQEFLNDPVFKVIQECATQLSIESYVVGGWVRDRILQRPSKDIDIVAIGSGIELAIAVASKLGDNTHVSIFKNFGTAQLKIDELEIEFVGARKESYRAESRKPIVEDGTLQDDLKRRDFTINAMAISLNAADFGKLIDPFNGQEDIINQCIRTPLDPTITYSDDPLRMMRAIRFSSQLQFAIEKSSCDAIAENRQRIQIVSKERIVDELNKIILSSKPSTGFLKLYTTGLLKIIFPQFVLLQGVETKDGKSHKDNFYHTLEVLDNLCNTSTDLWLRWAAILHDIAKPQTKRFEPVHGWTFHGHEDRGARMVPKIFADLKLPLNEKMKFVQKMVQLHLRPIVLAKSEVTDAAVRRLLFEAGDDIDALMLLCEADITSKNPIKVKRYLANFELVREKLKIIEEKDKMRNWQPPISGETIMQTFNLPACRQVGVIKLAIREALLDGKIENNYQAAFQYMLIKAEEMGFVQAPSAT